MNLWVAVLLGIGILVAMLGILFLTLLVIVKIRVHAVYTQEDDINAKPQETKPAIDATFEEVAEETISIEDDGKA